MKKQEFIEKAKAQGLEAHYSGKDNKMFVSGEDTKVKYFIRLCCLKGKKSYTFSFEKK